MSIFRRANGSLVSIDVHTTQRVARLSQCFMYLPPAIATVSPPSNALGCSVDGCVLTIFGDNFGSPQVLPSPPVVLVNAGLCVVRTFGDTNITCHAPPGSGIHNTVTVRLMNRTAALNGTAFAYSAPTVSYVLPPVVDQHVLAPLLLIGANFASTRLVISISGVPCATPAFIECVHRSFTSPRPAGGGLQVHG